MKAILIISIGLVYILVVSGQNDGRYRPTLPFTTRRRPSIFNNRYRPYIATTRRPYTDIITPTVARSTIQGKGSAEGGNDWRIIQDVKEIEADGYHYLYETENGILAEEQGRIENLSGGEEGLRAKGFFEYTGDDGLLYRVDYIADDNGFIPQGDHIPKTPPHVPKLLAYLAANAPTNQRR